MADQAQKDRFVAARVKPARGNGNSNAGNLGFEAELIIQVEVDEHIVCALEPSHEV
jgi:hypothetical protein